MGEFQDHHVQKRMRHLPLCARHSDPPFLVDPHARVDITGLGDECVWCGTDDEPQHVPAIWLVDLVVV